MKKVNSISGGKTSAYIAANYPADYNVFSLVCLDDVRCKPKDKGVIKYVNEKLGDFYNDKYGDFIATAEDDKTLTALMDLEQYIGTPIEWVRGRSFDKILTEKRFFGGKPTRLPSWARRYCTTEMKMLPIFLWWFDTIGEKIEMRIGFRFDEFKRMEMFMNKEPNSFKIPVACKTTGQRRQVHQTFNWRYCSFPLIQEATVYDDIKEYWRTRYVGRDTLFTKRRKIEFPEISNCVGCLHKKEDTIAIMYNLHPEKMNWFADQEERNMGTWLDSQVPYAKIGEHALSTPYIVEMLRDGHSCDSGGCHD